MNLSQSSGKFFRYSFRCFLALKRLLPKRYCNSFGINDADKTPGIENIYVINLDREPGRWSRLKQELKHILGSSGSDLLSITERHTAVDAKEFYQEPSNDSEIDPFYTLGDQLFVEPQPEVFPKNIKLDTQIKVSRAEFAVTRSHINVWKKVASSNYEFALILEDDVWFYPGFSSQLDKAWSELTNNINHKESFDVLYLSYEEVKYGAPKNFISKNLFRPERGLWHLSGYVLSREGAKKLLQLLPCRGPIDLWINHKFNELDVLATKRSLIRQRSDTLSSNSYSILPALTTIGALNSEGASLFNISPTEKPVFVFGPCGSGLSSLAMALSMLGYRCCSDLQSLPDSEHESLIRGGADRVFDAYVNIGSLDESIENLQARYPNAKFICTDFRGITESSSQDSINKDNLVTLYLDEKNKWKVVCEHLRCAPPTCSYPVLEDLGQRPVINNSIEDIPVLKHNLLKHDNSPWVIKQRKGWRGNGSVTHINGQVCRRNFVRMNNRLEYLDTKYWFLRSDTFTDNLALFSPSNVEFSSGAGATFTVKRESVGVRNYSAASLCSQNHFLYGKFEATIQASNVPGVVTGFFLHRNSPRQEIDIEITGNRPDRLLVNVFYNPGSEGSNFDYGYRGTPSYINLGFDASKASHRYTIEWGPNDIRWYVDDKLIHRRSTWDPTPIPHLPMTLHVNSWLTRSTKLAGRINNHSLPATTIVRSITLEANSVTSIDELSDLNRAS